MVKIGRQMVFAFSIMMIISVVSMIACGNVAQSKPSIGPAFYWSIGLITGMINMIIFQSLT